MLKSAFLFILFVVGYVIKIVYEVLFGWWLSPLIAHGSESVLKAEIQRDLSFLFENFKAQIAPNERKSTWGKTVTIISRNMRLQISLDRSEYTVRVSPLNGAGEWAPIECALIAIHSDNPAINSVPQGVSSSISMISEILKPQFQQLKEAYEEDRFPITRTKLERVQSLVSAEIAARIDNLKGNEEARASTIGIGKK